MEAFFLMSGCLVVLSFVIRLLVVRRRFRELDRDFSLELVCSRERALEVAVAAARGIMWQVDFSPNGLYTRHIFAGNVVHVALSDHLGLPGRCTAKVWTRCRLADDGVFALRARSVRDTRRKRDRVLRQLSAHAAVTRRDAPIR